MSSIQSIIHEEVAYSKEVIHSIHFPLGMPGFEKISKFTLSGSEEDVPFLWLQAREKELSFLIIDPFLVHLKYLPDVLDEDLKQLGIERKEDVLLLSIVNIKNSIQEASANLVGPIVINWSSKKGKQVILKNHHLYSVNHPISSYSSK